MAREEALSSVFQIASRGAGVWFKPAPAHESRTVWDRGGFVATAGLKIPVSRRSGNDRITIYVSHERTPNTFCKVAPRKGAAECGAVVEFYCNASLNLSKVV